VASPEAICGNCRLFDRSNAIGELVGSIDSANGKINKGYCRAPMGLLLRARRQTDPCKMPEGTFQPIDPQHSSSIEAPAH